MATVFLVASVTAEKNYSSGNNNKVVIIIVIINVKMTGNEKRVVTHDKAIKLFSSAVL